ncbi:hypothetical protein [Xanthomonas campestris]|uniref:hypothetical protein n=1 Tax=Xanthomonas campestris TaxID=339 RepID=UPI0011C3B625|nr:hypothetical protein [Xanthomonas campestris]MCC5067098.1 hypothetical protein [Xanthomonas campestris]MCC5087107.1 hypothetical protein [Xanthomonas campestris]MEB2230947.1 hypothetical protein [Xanthomonas campestris pv. campestris]
MYLTVGFAAWADGATESTLQPVPSRVQMGTRTADDPNTVFAQKTKTSGSRFCEYGQQDLSSALGDAFTGKYFAWIDNDLLQTTTNLERPTTRSEQSF